MAVVVVNVRSVCSRTISIRSRDLRPLPPLHVLRPARRVRLPAHSCKKNSRRRRRRPLKRRLRGQIRHTQPC
ncbi:hypothetical protein NFJ02_09g141490 [Pycnococcus provasolii]